VNENDCAWMLCRDLDDLERPLVVQRHVVHRGKEAHPFQSELRQPAPGSVGSIGRPWIEHEKADEPGWVASDRSRDGRLIARDARYQHGSLNLVRIEFLHPAVSQIFSASGVVPSELAIQIFGRIGRRALARKGREEGRREEVAVCVVDQNVTLNPI
jgi:hypothetical protein